MSNYIGVRCPVCNKKFIQADDIVVCPVCGAPHHRECYAAKSACAFASEHLSGKEWRPPAPEPGAPQESPDVSVCPACRSHNPKDVIFCQVCGKRMSEIPPQGDRPREPATWGFPGIMQGIDPAALVYGGLPPDEKIGGESVRDLAVYIGDNSAYYLTRFKIMDETSRSLSFNLSALVFGFLYFFHRKMYLIGAFLLVLFVAGAVPSFLQAREMLPQLMYSWGLGPDVAINYSLISHYQSIVNVTGSINFLICLVMSLCANHFYYVKALKDVHAIRESASEPHDEIAYNKALSLKGGSSRTAVIVVISVIVAAYFVVATMMSYQYMNLGGLYIRWR